MSAKSLAAIAALLAAASVNAADLKVLASNGVRGALEELAPAFERETGNKLAISFGLAAALKRQIEAGEAFDLAILNSAGIEDLVKQGKVDGATRTSIARSSVGIAVRKGAPRPDISSSDAFKRTLLSAKSITWAKEGQSGIYFAGLIEKIGLAEQLRSRIVPAATGAEVGKLVAEGRSELGVLLVNELMTAPGVDVVGPLHGDLQSYTVFHAGVGAGSKDAGSAKALIKFLTTPAAGAVFKAKGQDTGANF